MSTKAVVRANEKIRKTGVTDAMTTTDEIHVMKVKATRQNRPLILPSIVLMSDVKRFISLPTGVMS